MGISLDSLSITSAFNSILSFFKSQENNSKWKDYTSGAEGTFLIRMLANILSNISYRLVTARRENYLSTANLKSSALGIALNLGYSANRGTNQKRTIRFEPNGDYVIPPFTALGPYNGEYDVIYLGELDSETGLREGMILNGPLNIALVRGMSSLTRTITLATDVTKEFKSGDLLDISGTGTEADGRYTVSTMEVKTVGANNLTYVSVVERIKEIGVIRALGGRKKDVSHLFNAETLIIGFSAGVLGIVITYLLSLLINVILGSIVGVYTIASLPWYQAILMVAISIVLTMIAGLIPASSAAKKDPVVALRTE